MLNFHFVKLKKFVKQINKNNSKLNKNELIQKKKTWLYFIKNPNNEYFRNNKTPYLFKNAREKLISLQRNTEFYFRYGLREMELTDAISGLIAVEEKSLKRGEIIGEKRGRIEGKKNKRKKKRIYIILYYF